MMHVRSLITLLPLASFAACGPTTAEFGPAKSLPAEQRPTVWDTPNKVRLHVPDMGRASQPENPGDGEQRLEWTSDLPAGWETQPANPGMFRDAVWRVAGNPDTDISLTAAVGGGVAGNMSRWYRDQFGLDTVPAPEALPVVDLGGRAARLAEIAGTFKSRTGPKADWAALIAFAAQGDQLTTLKFTGPAAVVAGNKEKFFALAKSLRAATTSPDRKAPPIDPGAKMPEGHPPTNASNQPQPASPGSPFTATIPSGWSVKAGSSKPLHHVFGKDGEVYVSQLGGSLKSSLDIWRGEMGQKAPLTDGEIAALPKIAFLGEDAVLLDLTGDMQGMSRQLPGARLLVAARSDGGSITFAKFVASAADAAPHVEAFRAFCGSVRRAP